MEFAQSACLRIDFFQGGSGFLTKYSLLSIKDSKKSFGVTEDVNHWKKNIYFH